MKKKFFAIYALIGAMAVSPIFTSCVESEETPSVEALRNAKAEELKAIADLNNAQAASKTAIAAADAALINAKAEAQKAQNKLTEAKTALLETQNEAEKAALELTIKQAEADLARIQGEIDAQAIYIQAQLMDAQKQLLYAQQSLETATKDYDAYEKAKLQNLANEYSWAVQDLQYYQKQLITAKSQLVKLESGLVKAEDALEKTIAANNNQIALNNIQIETLKKYTNYSEDKDALNLERIEANSVRNVAYNQRNAAESAWNELANNIDGNAINEAWEEIQKDEFYQFVYFDQVAFEEGEETNNYGVYGISRYFNVLKRTWENNEHKYGDYEYNNNCGYSFVFEYEMSTDIRQIELVADDLTSWRKKNIKIWNEEIKTKQTALETAVAATKAAKKAWDEAADVDKDAKKAEYEIALNAELALASEIEILQSSVENQTKWVAIYDKALDLAKNAAKYHEALQAKIKAYNDANVAAYAETLAAWDKYIDADEVYQEANTAYWALSDLYWNANDIANSIKNLEDQNESLLAEIEAAEKLLTNYQGDEMPYEVAIELQKQVVAAREALVAAYEVKVKEAKEALDAAMPAEEETPAE